MASKTEHHPALMAKPTQSAVGNMAQLDSGEVLLPAFVSKRHDGVFLDPELIDTPSLLIQFIERVFSGGAYFLGLDYDTLMQLAYQRTPAGAPAAQAGRGEVRIARDICRFPPERQGLYRGVKSADRGARVEYVFEPAYVERQVESPLYGEDENGNPVITGSELRTESVPVTLDIDEFIAAMWQKGVRYGIDFMAVKAAIASGRTERVDIARRVDPADGTDATVNEQTDAMHRDDSPSILPNGKVDLRHFKNRFPQVSEGTRLLKKIPRRFGQLGYDTNGTPLEPGVPRDFELTELAGEGTRIERTEQGEFIVAARDGFLNIDTQSQMISVTEKIVNRSGVSLRTTGNLSLAGDEFEEHGEVQERRLVEGKHMSFHADVFGSINSSGGRVHLLSNLAGGKVCSTGGSIRVDKRASQAVLEARGGEVFIGQAEGVTIIADKVKIEKAVGCDIVAEEVEIDDASACAITARRIHLIRAGDRKGVETLVSVWAPDFSGVDKRAREIEATIAELEQGIASAQAVLADRLAMPEIIKYMAVNERIRSGALKLTDAQQAQWQQAAQKLARPLQEIRIGRDAIDKLKTELLDQQKDLATVMAQRNETGTGVSCVIDGISGDVVVRTQVGLPGAPVCPGITPQDMKTKLRDPRDVCERLFRGDAGSFTWTWKPQV